MQVRGERARGGVGRRAGHRLRRQGFSTVQDTKDPLKHVLSALCLASLSAYALPLSDIGHGFSLDVPAGYVRLEDSPIPGALHVYRREPIIDGAWGLISLTPLGGTISQRPPIRSIVEASAKEAAAKSGTIISRFEYRSVTWKDFPLEVMVMRADTTPSGPVVSFTTQLPLKSGAIQLQVIGLPTDEARLLREFEGVVGSVKGETNWGMTVNDARQLGERVGFVVGSLAVPGCCMFIAGLVAWLLLRKRPAKQ